jgi:Ca2+-binding EF-hand superfamily protein
VSFGLDGTEPMNDDISANDLAKIQEIQREECQYFSEEQMAQISPLTETITNSTVEEQQQVVEVEAPPSPRSPPSTNEILFDLIDTDHDGVVTKDDLVVGVTENIEVQSMLEAEGSILFYDPSDAKTATVWMDVFDNLITKNVNGNINCAEFSTFMDNLNQIQRQTNAQVAAEVEQQKEEDS